MGTRDISELQGKIITHNKVGACEVLQILDINTAKAKVRICDTNEEKTFVLSSQFFSDLDDFKTSMVVKTPVKKTKHIARKVDLDKYRNHPLVKQIDKMESKRGSRIIMDAPIIETDDDEDESEEMVL